MLSRSEVRQGQECARLFQEHVVRLLAETIVAIRRVYRGQAVKRLQHRHHRTVDARLAPLGITLVQWDALRAISQHPNASSHRINPSPNPEARSRYAYLP